jgi:hypothetical protein
MKTKQWERRARIDNVVWDLDLSGGRLDAYRNGFLIRTVYSDGREETWWADEWPEEIVAAWQEMLDVMRREAGR